MHKAGICCSFGTRRASWLFLARLFPPSSDTICLCKTLQLPSVNFTVNTQLPRLLGKESSSARPWPLLEGAKLGCEDLSPCHRAAGTGSSAVVALSSQQLHPSWTSTSGGKCGVQLNPGHLQHPGHLCQLLMFPLSSFSAVSHQGGQPTPATWDPCPHPRCTKSQPCKPPSDKRPPQKATSVLEKKPSLAHPRQQCICYVPCQTPAWGFHHSNAQILQARMPELRAICCFLPGNLPLFGRGQLPLTAAGIKVLRAACGRS